MKKLLCILLMLSLVACSTEYTPEPPNPITLDTLSSLRYANISTENGMVYSDGLELGFALEDTILLYGYPITETADDAKLHITYIPQEHEDMCWAACTAMLINYKKDLSLSTFDVSTAMAGGTIDSIQAIAKEYGCKVVEHDTPLSFSDIKKHILSKGPLMLTVSNEDTLHDVICYGYRETEDVQGLWIMDPIDERHGGLKILTPDFSYGACHREANTLYHTVYVWEKTRYIK